MKKNEYEYRVRGWAQLYDVAAFGIFAGGLILLALFGENSSAVKSAYLASALCLVLLGGYALRKGQQQRKRNPKIKFKAESLFLPKSILSQTFIDIPYSSINSVEKFSPARSSIKVITIKHDKNRTEISEKGFENRKTFNAVYEQLKEITAGNTP